MKHRMLLTSAAIAAVCVAAFVVLQTLSADDKPKLKKNIAEICLECHKETGKAIAAGKGHAPAKEGKCEACHNPHASHDRHLLRDEERALCLRCHATTKTALEQPSVHTPIARDGKCVVCHMPHASGEDRLLSKPPERICATCHAGAEKGFAGVVAHPGVREGKCLDCHDAHASANPMQLRSTPPGLCLSCHRDSAKLTAAHGGTAVAATNCSVCHKPHTSEKKRLLKGNIHHPVESGECGACHNPPEPGKPIALVEKIPNLCFKCHAQEKIARGNVVHAPIKDGNCRACHDPHASNHRRLLKADAPDLCFNCHGEQKAKLTAKSPHAPFAKGECMKCHQPHAASQPKLTAQESGIKLCETCHKRHAHPLDVKPSAKIKIDPTSRVKLDAGGKVTCASCHDPHGAECEKSLRYSKDRDLCIQCHVY